MKVSDLVAVVAALFACRSWSVVAVETSVSSSSSSSSSNLRSKVDNDNDGASFSVARGDNSETEATTTTTGLGLEDILSRLAKLEEENKYLRDRMDTLETEWHREREEERHRQEDDGTSSSFRRYLEGMMSSECTMSLMNGTCTIENPVEFTSRVSMMDGLVVSAGSSGVTTEINTPIVMNEAIEVNGISTFTNDVTFTDDVEFTSKVKIMKGTDEHNDNAMLMVNAPSMFYNDVIIEGIGDHKSSIEFVIRGATDVYLHPDNEEEFIISTPVRFERDVELLSKGGGNKPKRRAQEEETEDQQQLQQNRRKAKANDQPNLSIGGKLTVWQDTTIVQGAMTVEKGGLSVEAGDVNVMRGDVNVENGIVEAESVTITENLNVFGGVFVNYEQVH